MEFLHIIILLFQFFFHSLIFLFPTGTLRKLGPTANTRMYEWTLMEKECINCFLSERLPVSCIKADSCLPATRHFCLTYWTLCGHGLLMTSRCQRKFFLS